VYLQKSSDFFALSDICKYVCEDGIFLDSFGECLEGTCSCHNMNLQVSVQYTS
jgi:hypothetical protein